MESINKMMAVIAAVAMVAVCLVAVAAPADAEGTEVEVSDEQELRTALTSGDATVISIKGNITLTSYIEANKAVTINGNGFTLTADAGWTIDDTTKASKYMLTFTKDSTINGLNLVCSEVIQAINVYKCSINLEDVDIDGTRASTSTFYSSINVNDGTVKVTSGLTTDHGVELTSTDATASFEADSIEGVGPVYQAPLSKDTKITAPHTVEGDASLGNLTLMKAYFSNIDEAVAFYSEYEDMAPSYTANVNIVDDDILSGDLTLPGNIKFTIDEDVNFVFKEESSFALGDGSTFTNNGNTEFRGKFTGTIVNNGTATVYPTSNVTEEIFSEDSTGTPVFEDDEGTDEPDTPVNPPVDDEDTLPFPPAASQSGSDDDVTVVACAAAAVVAALMAAFLILGSKKD